MSKRFAGELKTKHTPRPALAIQLVKHSRVIGWGHDRQDVDEILGGRPDKRRPADVDLFNERFEWHIDVASGFYEGIEIDGNNIDESDAVAGDGGHIVRAVSASQDAAMYGRMQRLDASVHQFRHPCYVRDAGHRHSGRFERSGRSPGGNDVVTPGGERRANSTIPVLSETLSRARGMDAWRISWCGTATAIS